MFDTTVKLSNNTYNTLKVNAVSGGIYKTYRESWFKSFHLDSDFARTVLNGHERKAVTTKDIYGYQKEKVEVIQMVICGEKEVIAEIIKSEDLDKYLIKETI